MNRVRLVGLPVAALVLVVAVLGIQLAQGGGSFEPVHTTDPCVPRNVTSQAQGVEALTERLVLLGIDGAACRLHLSREALTLKLADPGDRTKTEISALRAGLKDAVRRMKANGSLPKASALVNEVLDGVDLNSLLEAAIRALPDGVVNAALRTDDILLRTIDDLDLRKLLTNLDDQHSLEQQIQDAVLPAVKDSLVDRITHLL